ncbi:unnamed protein product [Mesocestoides corti]|uniref:Uncharacterized protein n=1 Tax=Mesocestoides corti TaxID=53468 RepID=A0A0R3ULT9_MESCO|nr:unnamed protein product [Mesocestoides corti]
MHDRAHNHWRWARAHSTDIRRMDRFYPNFYSLQSVPAEPLDPRFKRRSWNAFPDASILPYTLYSQEVPQNRQHQRCSSEAPAVKRSSTFISQDAKNDIQDDDLTTTSVSPIPPIAVVKPTMGGIAGGRIHRPRPCYGSALRPAVDLPPLCMQISTPEVAFSSLCQQNIQRPNGTLPRRRSQQNRQRREVVKPAVRHSVFECPNVIDYGPLQPSVQSQELTIRRRARRHPELVSTEPVSRRRLFGTLTTQSVPFTDELMSNEDQSSSLVSESLPPVCVHSERLRRGNRVSVIVQSSTTTSWVGVLHPSHQTCPCF